MVKKSLIIVLTAIILSLCCGMCFAAENNNEKTSVNLGNKITQSIDKAGQSFQNMTDDVFSENMVNDMGRNVENMGRDVVNGINNVGNSMENTMNNMDNVGMNRDGNVNDDRNNNVDNGIVNDTRTNNNGDYTAARTTAETDVAGFTTMSTITWMWIILAVAAIIIIAAIWYYATQNND